MEKGIQSSCPACLSETHVFSVLSSLDATRHFKAGGTSIRDFELLRRYIENLWKSDSCLRRICDNCNLIFADPFVAGDSFFYNFAQSSHIYPKDRWEYRIAIDKMKSQFDGNFSLLEIGAGTGEFLLEVLKHGLSKNHLLAIEFDNVGVNTITNLGINCLQVDLREAGFPKSERFSAIVMFQVFEHLDDLDTFLESIVQLLQHNGNFVVSVPNYQRILFMESAVGFIDMPPNHLTTWSREALDALFKRHGLKMDFFEIENAQFLDFMYQVIYYSILKRRQAGSEFEKRILSLRPRKLRILFFVVLSLFHFFYRFPKLLQFNSKLGGSQVAIFKKI